MLGLGDGGSADRAEDVLRRRRLGVAAIMDTMSGVVVWSPLQDKETYLVGSALYAVGTIPFYFCFSVI